MKNKIRTMQGKSLDFEELALRNEKTVAMGNMKVNAAGEKIKDTLSSNTEKREKKSYRRQIQNKVFDMPVMESQAEATKFQRTLAKEYIKEEREEKRVEEVIEYKTAPDSPETKIIDESKVQVKEAPKAADLIKAPEMVSKFSPQPKPEEPKEQEKRLNDVKNNTSSGLAGAIAKAKQVKQDINKSPREQLRSGDGVRKI